MRNNGDFESICLTEQEMLNQIRASFKRDLLNCWYPSVIDETGGGYFTNLNEKWEPSCKQVKFLVGQSRHLWLTSSVACLGEYGDFNRYAEHGFLFLLKMWDERYGGFFTDVSRSGKVRYLRRDRQLKTCYGNAFAIYGLCAYFRLTCDDKALQVAIACWEWLLQHSYDHDFGGFVTLLDRSGQWHQEQAPHLYSKQTNSLLHLLEALTDLYRCWPDRRLEKHLQSLLHDINERMIDVRGFVHDKRQRDWSRFASGKGELRFSWGHDVEAAFLLLNAADALGNEYLLKQISYSTSLVEHALASWGNGSVSCFPFQGSYYDGDKKPVIKSPKKEWWVAAETMTALLLMHRLYPECNSYYFHFCQQWRYVCDYFLDEAVGGWYGESTENNPQAALAPKAHWWKASYHDGRAYMNCIAMLEGRFYLTNSVKVARAAAPQ